MAPILGDNAFHLTFDNGSTQLTNQRYPGAGGGTTNSHQEDTLRNISYIHGVGGSEAFYTGRGEELNLSAITAEPPASIAMYSPGDSLSPDFIKKIRAKPPIPDDTFREKPRSTLIQKAEQTLKEKLSQKTYE